MGLFDAFTKEGKLKKHVRRMSDMDAMPEDREASAKWLADEGSAKALHGLLTRFDESVTNGMKDQAEKEFTLGLLLRHGDAVERPLRHWLERCRTYAWPLRLALQVLGEDATVQAVFALLRGKVGAATFEPQRRKELLVWLAEHPHEGTLDVVVPFLADFDEEVRYAAAEVVLAQRDDAGRAALVGVLANPEEESLRLKHRIAGAFRARGWAVGDQVPDGALPDGFQVRDGRIVAL